MFNKTLIAAAVLAFAGSANAAVSTSAGGELVLVAYNSLTQNTFAATLDSLVGTASSFVGTSSLAPFNFAGANWNSLVGNGTGTTTWSVVGVNNVSTAVKTLWTTSNDINTAAAGTNADQNAAIIDTGVAGSFAAYTGGVNGQTLVASGAAGDASNNILNQWSVKLNKFHDAYTTGTDVGFYSLTKSGTKTTTNLAVATFAGVWNLSNAGTLTYTVASVPEADTWAMMVAGLGLMGFVARRRFA